MSPTSAQTLLQQYHAVCSQIAAACQNAKREANEVQLIAVSKTFPVSDIRTLHTAGQRHFGENYIQEWLQKTEQLADLSDIVWHVIGDVQSNKTKHVAERAAWLHTLSRLKIAQRLSQQRPRHLPPLQVCIEVNIANEANKHGVPSADAVNLALEIAKLPNLNVRGFMCVAKADSNERELRQQFATMQNLLSELQQKGIAADTLSMGMSGDMNIAIACGATQVRVGSAIFGRRDYGVNA
ncbi:MAG: YggS family pyridoxal phosphate-dependent enzyme [Neisseria sp.]|nr:YggS family pyridoxal phosphate-dependent enzyme [Neisseria sp.]